MTGSVVSSIWEYIFRTDNYNNSILKRIVNLVKITGPWRSHSRELSIGISSSKNNATFKNHKYFRLNQISDTFEKILSWQEIPEYTFWSRTFLVYFLNVFNGQPIFVIKSAYAEIRKRSKINLRNITTYCTIQNRFWFKEVGTGYHFVDQTLIFFHIRFSVSHFFYRFLPLSFEVP